MSIYNRICALPKGDKMRLFTFYERYLGSADIREVLGECHFQASEYCASINRPADYSKELRDNLEKIQFFYPDNDPVRIAIQQYFEKAQANDDYLRKEFLDSFFEKELQDLLMILHHKQSYLTAMIPQVKQYHNFAFADIVSELNSYLKKLAEDLEFIVIQLEQTRFAGKYIESFDGLFETELLKLINIYSVLLLEMASLFQKFHQREHCVQIYNFIEKLLQSSLVIRHPTVRNAVRACTQKMSLYKFVLKTNSNLKFQADFFAPVLLKNVKDKIKCKVLLVNENVANGLIEHPETWTDQVETCAALSNAQVDFKEDNEKGLYSAKFERLSASNVTRSERRITDIVTDSKVVFVFHCSFKYEFRDIKVRGFSQPVVFVVHVVQESSAHGTMSWHNALTKHSHSRREAPSEVPYAEVAKILNDRFFYTTGRGLTLDNLKHIRNEPFVDDNSGTVTAKSFLKDVIQEFTRNHQKEGDIKETKDKRAPSFWDWFYECNKLTISSFKESWKRGLIEGFIPKRMASQLLMNEPLGSFIIRFSQSMLGVVSFDNNYGLAPFFSSADFKDKTLDRCILSHQSLSFLYPNRRVEDFFTSSPPPSGSTSQHPGYAKPIPTYIIPRIADICSPASQNGTYSNISQSPYASPAHPYSSPASSSAYTSAAGPFPHQTPTHSNAPYQQFIQSPIQPPIQQAGLQRNPMVSTVPTTMQATTVSAVPTTMQNPNVTAVPTTMQNTIASAVPTTMQNSLPQNQNPNSIHMQGLQSPQILSNAQLSMFPQSPQPSQYSNLPMQSPSHHQIATQQPIRAQSVHSSNNPFCQPIQNQSFIGNNFPENNMEIEDFSNGPVTIPPFDTFTNRNFHHSPNYPTPSFSSPNYSPPSNQPMSYRQSPNYN